MKQKNPVLTTERLVLKAYEDRDEDRMVAILTNEEIKKTFMIPDYETREQVVELFRKLKEFSVSDRHFEYGIYLDGEIIGFLNDCDIEGTTIEVGYVIDPAYRGHGYAPEALRAAIAELFRMGYTKVSAGYFVENEASRRVMEKSGMHPTDEEDEEEYQGVIHRCRYCSIEK